MSYRNTTPEDVRYASVPHPVTHSGKDEMNLAEFPFSRLGSRDNRLAIEYHGNIVDKKGQVQEQTWIVNGSVTYGLPTEFAERVLIALMAITAEEKFTDRKVAFTPYRILRMLGLTTGKVNYDAIEKALDQLVGVTIYSKGAFWDKALQKRVTTKKAFHILEEYWLKSTEDDAGVIEAEGVNGYVIWSERIWNSFEAGYIKNLDTDFYYSLKNTLARRLYRFLDKRMHYQNTYQIDIYDLAGRLGMKQYRYASDYVSKLKPSFQELITRDYLASAEVVKVGKYKRIQFVRASADHPIQGLRQVPDAPEDAEAPLSQPESLTALYASYKTPDALQQVWAGIQEDFQRSNPASYDMFYGSALLRIEDGTATIAAKAHNHDWIANRMRRQLVTALTIASGEQVTKIHLVGLEGTN